MNRETRAKICEILMQEFIAVDNDSLHFVTAVERIAQVVDGPEPAYLTGFEIISDMSREQMIQECIAFQVRLWNTLPEMGLRQMVVAARMNSYRDRLMLEAGLEDGPAGFASFPSTNG